VAKFTTNASPSRKTPQLGLAESGGSAACGTAVATAEPEVVLASSGAISTGGQSLSAPRVERYRQLAIAIRQRIESRLAGRVRDLAVRISGDAIVLEGRCATYYSKQLAQHAALGVLDGEHLENAIVVTM
jgi:hypothetical protein